MVSYISRGWSVRVWLAALLLAGTVVVANQGRPALADAAPASASVFTPMSPQRLVDTRSGLGAPQQRLQTATSMDVQVTGQLGIPDNATAVVANVTAVDASGPGYLQVLPTGRAEFGSSSTINVDAPGQTIPNATFAPLGDGGRLTIYAIFSTDVVIDISGYFTPAASSAAGRLVPLEPSRILDTRIGLGWDAPAPASPPPNPGNTKNCTDFQTQRDAQAWFDQYFAYYGDVARLDDDGDGIACESLSNRGPARSEVLDAATVVTLQVAGRGGVPSAGVSAVVMNVTAVDPFGPGFVQVAPTPVVPGASSNLNTAAGRTIANLVVVPLAPTGTVDLYLTTPADLVADVVGYFTDGTAANSSVGLFVPISPDRQLDTRQPPFDAPPAGGSVTPIDINDVSPTAIAIAGNLTATETSQAGYLQLAGKPVSPGTSSNLNVSHPGQTIANAVVSPVSAGLLELFHQNATHELLDVTGWFTSSLTESGPPVPTEPPITTPPWLKSDGRIAFVRDGQIFTIDADGTDEVQLTSVATNSVPRWSPDGQRIAFVRDTGPSAHEIWMMNADGSDQHRVAVTGWVAAGAAWSPDGQRLAFQPASGPAVVRTLSTGVDEPLMGGESSGDEPEQVIFAGTPDWSPTGDAIAFVSGHAIYDSVVYDYELATHRLDIVTYFYHGGCSSVHTFGDPSIAPDATRIGFSFIDSSVGLPECPAPARLEVDAYHGLATQTFVTEDGDIGLAFSPSGTRTVIANDAYGTARLVVADAEGGGRVALVDGEQPDWQPLD
ncbi:MAG: PD40 domain-containing protein [Actinobacteria bacterium]|nr:PD40 domain-containing protein [Actinomycetota bacterium]